MKSDDLLLYGVTDRRGIGNLSLTEAVRQSLDGGVTFVQLREKHLGKEKFAAEARSLKALCAEYGVPFVINDDVQLAIEVEADGVHVGQSDMAAGDVRARIGKGKILGVSAQTVEQAVEAEKCGADYLGVGAVFPTGSKDDAEDVSYDTLRDICNAVSIPVIAIGGITADNAEKLIGSGICGVAVISAIYCADDITQAACALRAAVERVVKA